MPKRDAALVKLGVVGGDHAAFADGKGFTRHHARGGDVAERPAIASVIKRAVRVGVVLDHPDAVLAGDGKDAVVVGRMAGVVDRHDGPGRSEEHTSELQSLMRISYAVFCLKKKITIRDRQ